jgi:hypothetical protein
MSEEYPFKIAILDDCPVSTKLQQRLISTRFPGGEITVCHEPRLLPGQDVYLIDNQFGTEEHALELARRTRAVEPDALIIVWSATITKELLKRLARIGINAVAEKGNPADTAAALDVMAKFFRRPRRHHTFGETIHSIHELLVEWNAHLEHEEKQATA